MPLKNDSSRDMILLRERQPLTNEKKLCYFSPREAMPLENDFSRGMVLLSREARSCLSKTEKMSFETEKNCVPFMRDTVLLPRETWIYSHERPGSSMSTQVLPRFLNIRCISFLKSQTVSIFDQIGRASCRERV